MSKQCKSCGGDCGRTEKTGCRYKGRLTDDEIIDMRYGKPVSLQGEVRDGCAICNPAYAEQAAASQVDERAAGIDTSGPFVTSHMMNVGAGVWMNRDGFPDKSVQYLCKRIYEAMVDAQPKVEIPRASIARGGKS